MKKLIKISVAFVCFSCIQAGCASAQPVDLSTDKAVREKLAKNTDFKSNPDNLCIERLKESAKIIVIGNHANDRDCRIDGVFVDSRYFDAGDATLSKTALNALGWKMANQQKRENLAKLWVENGLLVFYRVLYTRDKDFKEAEFQPPKVVSNENGETVVTLWTSIMNRKKEFEFFKFIFAVDGSLLKS
ncbi:MAG: hypothetical protein ABJA66_07560 [Actinomycetota bacterium]